MKKLLKKLRGKAGESLVETLCSILIFTLASVAMYSMVMASNSINAKAKEADQNLRDQMIVVEKAEGNGVPGHVVMTIDSGDNVPVQDRPQIVIPVEVYQAEEMNSYFRVSEGGSQ